MALGEKVKKDFSEKIALRVSQVSRAITGHPLEGIFVLLILVSLFSSGSKIVLGLFVLLYFADRWGAADRLKEITEPPKPTVKREGEVDN